MSDLDAVTAALRAILDTQDPRDTAAVGASYARKRVLKEAFAPIASHFKWKIAREVVVQRALELPADALLHRAARALVADGTIAWTPWVSITSAPRPKRCTRALLIDHREPIVYALEEAPRLSMWSLETGEHVADLPLPGNRGTHARRASQLSDGTLRVLTSKGAVCQCAPGSKHFDAVSEVGSLATAWTASEDLAIIVNRPSLATVDRDGKPCIPVMLHDVNARRSHQVLLPFDSAESNWQWHGGRAIVVGRRSRKTGPDEDDCARDYGIASIDGASGAVSVFPLDREPSDLRRGGPDHLALALVSYDADGGSSREWVGLDLRTHTISPIAEPREPSPTATRATDGRAFDDRTGALVDASGALLMRYVLEGFPETLVTAFDEERGQLVLAGGRPDVPVTVVAPYSAERAATARREVRPEPLTWARPGVVLTYELVDFDAHDEWRFEVLSIDGGLTLAISMDETRVADRAVFTRAALDRATRTVSLGRGGADVDLSVEQDATLPPLLLARAPYRRFLSGKKTPWGSAWSSASRIEHAGSGIRDVKVGHSERAVRVAHADTNEGGKLTILDDAEWPLVIERVEGDCVFRLLAVDLSRAVSPVVLRAAFRESRAAQMPSAE